jgi:hypothetical protein
VNQSTGFISLALLYFFFGISTFLAPRAMNALGVKPALVVSSLTCKRAVCAYWRPCLRADSLLAGPTSGALGSGARGSYPL